MARIAIPVVLTLLVTWSTAALTPPSALDRALDAQVDLAAQNPTDPTVLNDLANLLVVSGRLEEAEPQYVRALELAPEDVEIRFNYAVLLQQEGRDDEAEIQLRKILELDPGHAWALYQLGVVVAAHGERHDALELFARAFAADPALTFARNNPHLIENPLTTEALLMSNRYQPAPGARVPRRYGDPGRILDLMLVDVKGGGETTAEPAEEMAAPEETPKDGGSAHRVGGGSLEDEERLIDITTQGANQREPAATRPRSTKRDGAATTRQRVGTGFYVPGQRPAADSDAAAERATGGGGSANTNTRKNGGWESSTPATRLTPAAPRSPRSRPGYRPPVRSTGRLELELLPVEEPAATDDGSAAIAAR